jgi:hypothetical protein
MAKTVNEAFGEFMKNFVNLDPTITANARASRDNLLNNIAEFDESDGFFDLCDSFNVHFGSFARKTQCRELDDIDLMIGIAANGATYYSDDEWSDVRITASTHNAAQRTCANDYGYLNSTSVLNKFKSKLASVREYSRSEINRHGEAIILNLKSKDWSFDIVPCFHTVTEADGRAYYLIPNGKGNWKKTDPTIDRDDVTKTNQDLGGKMLSLIRLAKYWNQVLGTAKISSYLLETMIVTYCQGLSELSDWIDLSFRPAIESVQSQILSPVYDLKDIQGNINTIGIADQCLFSIKARQVVALASTASQFENNGNHRDAIGKWREIFGGDFPTYG